MTRRTAHSPKLKRSLEGIKEMRSMASEGHASVTLEFDAGFDAKSALADVREKVDTARESSR